MSWRRFVVLLRCLSPNSATVSRLQSTEFIGQAREGTVSVEGPEATDRALDLLYKR